MKVLIADELPRNTNGKLDLYRIGRGDISGTTYNVKEKHLLKCLSDIKLEPFDESQTDIIKETMKHIAADMKDGLPFIKSKTEDLDMNQNMNPFAGLNSMNQMGNQMMMNMMSMVGKMNQPGNNPCQQQSMEDASHSASNVQQINQMINLINQMNQQNWQMMQQMYAQNCQLTMQFYQLLPGLLNMTAANMPNKPFAQTDTESEAESEE
jgi:hypothetical protein